MPESLVNVPWHGLCPIDHAKMLRNCAGFWECLEGHLQITISGGIRICHNPGKGDFAEPRVAAIDLRPIPHGRIRADCRKLGS